MFFHAAIGYFDRISEYLVEGVVLREVLVDQLQKFLTQFGLYGLTERGVEVDALLFPSLLAFSC